MRSSLLILAMLVLATPVLAANSSLPMLEDPEAALIIIDVQDFYFPGGSLPLFEPEAASANAGRLLTAFRQEGRLVIHVGHKVQSGGEFFADVMPQPGESVVLKTEVNAFRGTNLQLILQEAGIKRLVLCGMQTHMCLEGATRAAVDLGYECIVVSDACATRDLKRGETVIKASDVHLSTLATLDGAYAQVVNTKEFLGL